MTTVTIPTLETEHLLMRAPQSHDLDPLADFMASQRSQFVGGPGKDRTESARALGHVAGQWVLRGYGMWVLVPKGGKTAIGMAGAWHPDYWPEREIGWSLWDADAEGEGYAHEAASAARAHLYAHHGWTTAVSYIDPENTRSVALAERLGCTLDANAARPHTDAAPCLVYRHPAATALS
jgi:RimJ/RimL family protein N-acetyltransferase